MKDLFMDFETFSSVDIKSSGAYKYIESPDFRLLLLSYAFDHDPVITIDLTKDSFPEEFEEALFDDDIIKHAHNATFERLCLKRVGYDIPPQYWKCTAVMSAYCGLPISLSDVSKVLKLKSAKLDTGKQLIKYFSCPCTPSRLNGYKTRHTPSDSPQKWQMYKEYNAMDVEAEREIYYLLADHVIPQFERDLYVLDQEINDRGIRMNMDLVRNAILIDKWNTDKIETELVQLTGLSNPNSVAQLKQWIYANHGIVVDSLTKETVPQLLSEYGHLDDLVNVLEGRQKLAKTSVKKYTAMLNCRGKDDRARGLFQFYGATRTGRWAGRLIQLQNLTKNHIEDIDVARNLVLARDGDSIEMMYDDVSSILSQLIRTVFIPKLKGIFHVADYSAIEARVVSWLADEEWRLEVFATHGKIYEAAASRMFNVPIEEVTKGSDYRAKAKNAELALGYQGALGAMKRMGGEKMGLSDGEMMSIVKKWRNANPSIVAMWNDYNECAIKAVSYQMKVVSEYKNIVFESDGKVFTITLPSGRQLSYRNPRIRTNRFNSSCVCYMGIDQETKMWTEIDTYGGKITENIVQAISRDIIGYAMLRLRDSGFDVVMHVHDEVISESDDVDSESELKRMCDIMGEEIPWAKGLPLRAEGFSTYYYKKD